MEVRNLVDVLKEMEAGQVFDLTACTCDIKRGRGGELRSYHQYRLLSGQFKAGRCRIRRGDGSGHPVLIHTRLITRYNGTKVIW